MEIKLSDTSFVTLFSDVSLETSDSDDTDLKSNLDFNLVQNTAIKDFNRLKWLVNLVDSFYKNTLLC